MARYQAYSQDQGKFISVFFEDQLLPGTFEHALNHIVDHELELDIFLTRYKNDKCGRPAIDPALLLKIVFFAYSHGITSSRKIAVCCQTNIVFKALSADTMPNFTTIAHFISSMEAEITPLFRNILLICEGMNLIGKEMFAIDGCKLSSNASKEQSGTHAELEKKRKKIEQNIKYILKIHSKEDKTYTAAAVEDLSTKRAKQIEKLRAKSKTILDFLSENEERIGISGKAIKSNITDKESGKMPSAHGVVQGYNGIATADAKHQIIVGAEAQGTGSEQEQLKNMIETSLENLENVSASPPKKEEIVILADNGFHSEKNMKYLIKEEIDGYIPDRQYRKRDPRFADADRYKKTINGKKIKVKYFVPKDFKMDKDLGLPICPGGHAMYLKNQNFVVKGKKGISYIAREKNCSGCPLREKCLRKPNTKARQVTFFSGKTAENKKSATRQMIEKIDTQKGREIYGHRMGLIEPVFGNIRSNLRLDHFSLRSQKKVNIQWLLYCMTHNIGKIQRYGQIAA
ncbi:MAG: IS1182 family transposase [Nitrospirae bacterium]|nr:IS1182 family transposase [Candidatus Manganitrophaceae bacterium]